MDVKCMALSDFIGQHEAVKVLNQNIALAKSTGNTFPHMLIIGKESSGKRTLVSALANELNVTCKDAGKIERPGDVAELLTNIKDGDILLISKRSILSQVCWEMLLYPMDCFALRLLIGAGNGANTIHLPTKRFTVVFSVEDIALVPPCFLDRLKLRINMEAYSIQDMTKLAMCFFDELRVRITDDAAKAVALHSNGNYRLMKRILKRAQDFSMIDKSEVIDEKIILRAWNA